jgi:hypothetical protein
MNDATHLLIDGPGLASFTPRRKRRLALESDFWFFGLKPFTESGLLVTVGGAFGKAR